MKNITESKLNTIPFAKTSPMSLPIVNPINTNAKNPAIVVVALDNIDTQDLVSVLTIASSKLLLSSVSNSCNKKTE